MITILWRENGQDRWDRFETDEDAYHKLTEIKNNPEACPIEDVWIYPHYADNMAVTGDIYYEIKPRGIELLEQFKAQNELFKLSLKYRQQQVTARQILADVADGTPNDTINSLTTKIIFGSNRKPQDQFE